MLLDGAPFAPGSPGAAIGAGVFMVPEDRAAQALVAGWSVRANASLPFLARLTSLGLVRKRAEADRARRIIDMLGVVCAGPEAPIGSLSGGNQQKVVVGRWLAEDGRVLIFDEPFRGVDIGARRDIAHRLRSLSDDVVVIVISSDLDEILEVADRVLVMSGGGVVADVRRSEVDRTGIALEMTGART